MTPLQLKLLSVLAFLVVIKHFGRRPEDGAWWICPMLGFYIGGAEPLGYIITELGTSVLDLWRLLFCNWGDQVKDDDMTRACSTHGREKFIQHFVRKI
jgi:hypothetical protein